jgi:membrane protein
VAATLGFLLVLSIGVVLPVALEVFGTSNWVQILTGAARWIVLWLMAALGLAVLYRYAPSRERARWRWVMWGSAIAATLFTVVIGAEINSEMERQTARDTTEGPEAPLGRRGAYAANTVGPSADRTLDANEQERNQGAPAISERAREDR